MSLQDFESMCHAPSTLWTTLAAALPTIIGAVIGGTIAYFVAEIPRKRKSVYDVADLFGAEAKEWAGRTYQIDNAFMAWHAASISKLSPHVGYLDRQRPKLYRKILPWWTAYSGGDTAVVVTHRSYLNKEKDEFVEALYKIADILRK